MTEKSPLPQDFRDVEQNSIVGKAEENCRKNDAGRGGSYKARTYGS